MLLLGLVDSARVAYPVCAVLRRGVLQLGFSRTFLVGVWRTGTYSEIPTSGRRRVVDLRQLVGWWKGSDQA